MESAENYNEFLASFLSEINIANISDGLQFDEYPRYVCNIIKLLVQQQNIIDNIELDFVSQKEIIFQKILAQQNQVCIEIACQDSVFQLDKLQCDLYQVLESLKKIQHEFQNKFNQSKEYFQNLSDALIAQNKGQAISQQSMTQIQDQNVQEIDYCSYLLKNAAQIDEQISNDSLQAQSMQLQIQSQEKQYEQIEQQIKQLVEKKKLLPHQKINQQNDLNPQSQNFNKVIQPQDYIPISKKFRQNNQKPSNHEIQQNIQHLFLIENSFSELDQQSITLIQQSVLNAVSELQKNQSNQIKIIKYYPVCVYDNQFELKKQGYIKINQDIDQLLKILTELIENIQFHSVYIYFLTPVYTSLVQSEFDKLANLFQNIQKKKQSFQIFIIKIQKDPIYTLQRLQYIINKNPTNFEIQPKEIFQILNFIFSSQSQQIFIKQPLENTQIIFKEDDLEFNNQIQKLKIQKQLQQQALEQLKRTYQSTEENISSLLQQQEDISKKILNEKQKENKKKSPIKEAQNQQFATNQILTINTINKFNLLTVSLITLIADQLSKLKIFREKIINIIKKSFNNIYQLIDQMNEQQIVLYGGSLKYELFNQFKKHYQKVENYGLFEFFITKINLIQDVAQNLNEQTKSISAKLNLKNQYNDMADNIFMFFKQQFSLLNIETLSKQQQGEVLQSLKDCIEIDLKIIKKNFLSY